MAFSELEDFLDEPPFVLTIRGVAYEFPGDVSAESWLRLHRLTMRALSGDGDTSEVVLDDAEEARLMDEMMGPAKARLLADGASAATLKLVWMTLIAYHTQGEAVAEIVWNARGEAPAPSRAVRRAAAAPSTRSRGSRASSNGKSRRPPAPRGPTSSPAGTRSRPT